MLLFETVVFENLVPGGVRPGLTHAVYEVDDLDIAWRRKTDVALKVEVCLRHSHVEPSGGDIIGPLHALYRKPHPRTRRTPRNLGVCPERHFPADGPACRRRGLGRDETQ